MQLILNPVGGWWFVALTGALLVLLAAIRPTHTALSTGRLWSLRLLRLLAVALVILAMMRPTLIYTESKPLEATLVVLVDDSRSMSVEDSLGNTSRWESLKSMLQAAQGSLAELAEKWDVKGYRFSDRSRPVAVDGGEFELPEEVTGDESALGTALVELVDREGAQRVLGVVVLSDGAQRAIPPRDTPPQVGARRLAAEGIPLYTFTFGQSSTGDRADLAIEDLLASDTIFAETPTDVTAQLRYQGYANQQVRVQLLWETESGEMESVDAQQVRLDGQSGQVTLRLGHTPTTPGEYKVTVRVAPQEGELITTNNESSTFVTVREGGINVLYLAGATRVGGFPHIEQRFVRGSLAASPDIVVTQQQFTYQQLHLDLTGQFEQGKFDVVVLDNLDSQALSLESWRELAALVRGGAGLLMTGGFQSFGAGGYKGTPVEDLLPVGIGAAERQPLGESVRSDIHLPGPVEMQPTALGQSHPIMQIAPAGDSADLWEELPPLDGANRLDRSLLKPNAVVLAEAETAARQPLLVAGQPGSGRSIAFAGDSTWRWVMHGHGEAHRRFWRQMILWLAQKDQRTEGDVWIELASRRVSRGSRLELAVGVETPEDQPVEDPSFDVQIVDPEGETVEISTLRDGPRRTGVFSGTGTPGVYTVQATANAGGTALGTATARFLVPEEDLELDRPAAEPALMAQLARITSQVGGKTLAPEELPQLLRELAESEQEVKEDVIARVTYWDSWPYFLALVALLGLEWYLRKRWGLV